MIADKLVALAARYRIRAIYEWPEFAAAGRNVIVTRLPLCNPMPEKLAG